MTVVAQNGDGIAGPETLDLRAYFDDRAGELMTEDDT
jgi:hypothetical protein